MSTNRRVSAGSSAGSDHGSLFDVEDGMRRKLKETDPHRLEQRQKAVDKGKNTKAYQNFLTLIPKATRPSGTSEDEKRYPRTPDKFEICSKRGWDGKVRAWRVRLHQWNPQANADEEVIQVPTAMTREEREKAGFATSPPQAKKREREGADAFQSAKRVSLGGAGGRKPAAEQPLKVSPLKVEPLVLTGTQQEKVEKVEDEDSEWVHPQPDGGPKTIFDAWEDEEEEEIGL